jgi:hypothetical protein
LSAGTASRQRLPRYLNTKQKPKTKNKTKITLDSYSQCVFFASKGTLIKLIIHYLSS